MKQILLMVGLFATGILIVTKLIGLAVMIAGGEPLERGFLLRQLVYAACFSALFFWLWGRVKAHTVSDANTDEEPPDTSG